MTSKIISNRGYSILKDTIDEKQLKQIKKDLTLTPINIMNMGNIYSNDTKSFKIYLESPKRIYMPKYYGLSRFGIPDLDKISSNNKVLDINIKFQGELRDKQIPVAKAFIDSCDLSQSKGGGLICLPCGYGKTILGLYIASQLKKKTLIVCHKEFLLNQWKERIMQFIPEANIGIVQQKKVMIEDKDIVLAMLQSLSMKDYPEDTFSSFGFTIFDECHHLGAEVFSRALAKITTPYMLGLSATPDRKDGLSKVFEYYLGNMVYCVKQRDPDKVQVKLINYYSHKEEYITPEINIVTGKINSPLMITKVCQYKHRTQVMIKEIINCVKENRRVLILSERREHLQYFFNQLNELNIECGYYVGGMKQNDLDISAQKKVVLGTFHLASEGMDVPSLNTVILASPKSDIEQSIGRIFRQKAEDRTHVPLIIDVVDQNIPSFKRQFTKRNKIYKQNKYLIEKINIYDDDNQQQKITQIYENKEIKFDNCMLD